MRAIAFLSCPIASRFIDTREDALSYYAEKLVGDHAITVGGVEIVVRFNKEEIHLFTQGKATGSRGDPVARAGASGEVRTFSLERARLFDQILPTIKATAVALNAKMEGGVMLYGPADPAAQRLCVIVAPAREANVFFVRTAYGVAPKDFAAARRSGRAAPWPPK